MKTNILDDIPVSMRVEEKEDNLKATTLAKNSMNFFKKIVIKTPERFQTDVEYADYNHKYKLFDLALKEFHKKYPKFVNRGFRAFTEPATNRNMFPIDGDVYITAQDKEYYLLMMDLYNEFGESKFLINHCLSYPGFGQKDYYSLTASASNERKQRLKKMAPIAQSFYSRMIKLSDLSEVRIGAWKDTAMGFPFCDVKGNPVFRRDFMWGAPSLWNDPAFKLKMDQSKIKQDWIDKSGEKIFHNVVYFAEQGLNPLNLESALTGCAVNFCTMGVRKNNMDGPVNLKSNSYDGSYPLFGKKRDFMNLLPDNIRMGKFDTEKFSSQYAYLFPYPFACQRIRIILACSFVTGFIPQILAQMLMKRTEDSKNGFISNKPEVMAAYGSFISNYSSTSDDIVFIAADRKQADAVISSTYDLFLEFFPPGIRKYIDLFSHVVYSSTSGLRMLYGLVTGYPFTTCMNTLGGDESGTYILEKITGLSTEIIYSKICDLRIRQENYIDFGDFLVFYPLPTDNNVLAIIRKNGIIPDSILQMLESEAPANYLEFEYSRDFITGFGMKIDKLRCDVNPSSIFSKLFYSENPGYLAKDIFGVYSRLLTLSSTDRNTVDLILKKRLGKGVDYYYLHKNDFFEDLRLLGVDMSAFLSPYSPSDQNLLRIIKSKMVSDDPLMSKAVVDNAYFVEPFKFFKNFVA